jgi:hypothetical protein
MESKPKRAYHGPEVEKAGAAPIPRRSPPKFERDRQGIDADPGPP